MLDWNQHISTCFHWHVEEKVIRCDSTWYFVAGGSCILHSKRHPVINIFQNKKLCSRSVCLMDWKEVTNQSVQSVHWLYFSLLHLLPEAITFTGHGLWLLSASWWMLRWASSVLEIILFQLLMFFFHSLKTWALNKHTQTQNMIMFKFSLLNHNHYYLLLWSKPL